MEEVEIKKTEEMQEIKNEEIENNKEKNNKLLIFVIALIILIILILGYLIFIRLQKETTNQNDNPILSTKSDDVTTLSDDVSTTSDDEIDENLKRVYIYAKGLEENPPIAFTYDCISEACNIILSDKNLILFDGEKVRYRELTNYEYNQIYNSDSPIGEKLSMDGFKVAKSIYEIDEVDTQRRFVYKINNKFYVYDIFTDERILFEYEEYRKKGYTDVAIIDNLLLYEGLIYNIVDKKIIQFTEMNYSILDFKKEGSFYVFFIDTSEEAGPYYMIIDESLKYINYISNNGIYIKNNNLYYIDTIEKSDNTYVDALKELNNNNEISDSVENENETALYIFDDNLLYLDENDTICVKKILTGELIYNSNVEFSGSSAKKTEDGFELIQIDKSVIEKSDFDEFRKKKGIQDEELDALKKCIQNQEECELRGYDIGYVVYLDKEGKYLSKEYFVSIYN